MPYYDAQFYQFPQLTSGPLVRDEPQQRKARVKRKAKRTVNYASENRPKTEALHERILDALNHTPAITVRALAETVGISRQLCLYHAKKLVAHGRAIAELAPCKGNGGVQYVLYTKLQRAVELGAWLLRQQGRIAA